METRCQKMRCTSYRPHAFRKRCRIARHPGDARALLLALVAATASSEAQQIRFGIFIPKMDVFAGTQHVEDRLQEYLFEVKANPGFSAFSG